MALFEHLVFRGKCVYSCKRVCPSEVPTPYSKFSLRWHFVHCIFTIPHIFSLTVSKFTRRLCSRCLGCVSSVTGERYVNGASWTENDSCVQCTCVDGQKHCTASACERRCQNPRKQPGVCCPICDEEEGKLCYRQIGWLWTLIPMYGD